MSKFRKTQEAYTALEAALTSLESDHKTLPTLQADERLSKIQAELEGSVLPAITKMGKTARITDEDLVIYGPEMSAKVLELEKKVVTLVERVSTLQGVLHPQVAHAQAVQAEEARKREEEEERKQQEERKKREEEEAERARVAAEEAARLQAEEDDKQARIQEAAARVEQAEAGLTGVRKDIRSDDTPDFIIKPVDSDIELTIEKALAMQEEADRVETAIDVGISSLREESGSASNFRNVLRMLGMFARNVLEDPERRQTREIRVSNAKFQEAAGKYHASLDILRAFGFDDVTRVDEHLHEQHYLVMHRCNTDHVKMAMNKMDQAVRATF